MKIKKVLVITAICSLLLSISGCGTEKEESVPIAENGQVSIAILGDEDFYSEGGSIEAMKLASADIYEKYGLQINLSFYDDDADYHKTIAYAKELSSNPSIDAVISKQEMDYIDTVADIFEDAKKPFIVASGCYNHTIEKKYHYLLADFIDAKTAGVIMAQYIQKHGFKKAAFCHSDTEYEEDELRGFQSAVNGTRTTLVDTVVGPVTQEDFDVAYSKWEALGVDVICVSNYYIMNSEVVRMLREKGSDIKVVSDYVMETEEDIKANGKYLDGTVIVPLYIFQKEGDTNVTQKFKEYYRQEMLEIAVQSYDLIYMLGTKIYEGADTSDALMKSMKSKEGYEGIHGLVCFSQDGALIPTDCKLLTFSNGAFRFLEEEVP